MLQIGVYARLSIDDGTRQSTKRQVEDCRAFAALREWNVADVYVDRDRSAFSGVERPEFERLLRDLEDGALDGVLSWKFDRLVRRPREFERVWGIIEPRGAVLASATEPIDTSSDFGPLMARLIVGMAEMESKTISRRVKRAKQQARFEGQPKHGGHRGYGHDRDGRIVEAEAELIRQAAQRILDGDGVNRVALDWATLGAVTPTGGAWSATHLRRLLMQARLAGAREDADGAWHTSGAITPILDEVTVRRLRTILTDPSRVTNRGRVSNALLTGILHCGLCGSTMTTGKVKSRRMYGCRNRPGRPGCGKVSITVSLADEHIKQLVLDALDTPQVVNALNRPSDDPDEALAACLVADRDALDRLAADYYVARVISESEYHAARRMLLKNIQENETALSRSRHAPVEIATVRGEWEAGDTLWRRALIRLLVSRINCAPATRPYSRWDPDRLSVETTYAAEASYALDNR